MKNKIIVFGGTGDVGQIIVQKLLDKEQTVCVLTRQKKDSNDRRFYKVGNVLDFNTVEKLIEQDDRVIISLGFNNSSFDTMSKGTANIIKQNKTIVVPIVIDGFRRSFDRKGLRIKKKGILQSMVIKEPLVIDYDNESIEEIVEKIEFAIEQHPSLLKVIPVEVLQEQEELDKKRKWEY